MKNYVKQFNFDTLEEFKIFLNVNNIKFEKFKKKTSIELLWNRLIFDKFNNNIKIDEEKIKQEILSQEKKELFISEILFTVEKRKI